MRKSKLETVYCVIDAETDPFAHGATIAPFMWGFFDGTVYKEFRGDHCTRDLLIYLESRKEHLIIYAHNGGKFDFHFLLSFKVICDPMLIINGRITKAKFMGHHEIRDSYAAIPIPLKAYQKLDIDIQKFHKDVRHKHLEEISQYLKIDCTALYDLMMKFIARFGPKLTIGGTAIAEMRKIYPVPRRDRMHDQTFRPFYYGGRVECFGSGAYEGGDWKIYDVNSMYPKAMHSYDHPASGRYVEIDSDRAKLIFNRKTGEAKGFSTMYFIEFTGSNRNALPCRVDKDGKPDPNGKHGLKFNIPYARFTVCSHELKVALKLKLVTIDAVHRIYVPTQVTKFDKFVDKFIDEKVAEKRLQKSDPDNYYEHKANETFAKLIANSCYGKYATDPSKFKEHKIVDYGDDASCIAYAEWQAKYRQAQIDAIEQGKQPLNDIEMVMDAGNMAIFRCDKPAERGYFDVAVAASITSAARSILLAAIYASDTPLYCDTDSLICRALTGVLIDDAILGAWKLEGQTANVYIAGKKVYACENAVTDQNGMRKHKIASKGSKLTFEDIRALATHDIAYMRRNNVANSELGDLAFKDFVPGEKPYIVWKSEAPNFKLTGHVKYVSRKITATA